MIKIVSVLVLIALIGNVTLHAQSNFKLIYGFEKGNTSAIDTNLTITVLEHRLKKISSAYKVVLDEDKHILIETTTPLKFNRLNEILINQGKLEMWELFRKEEFVPYLQKIEDTLTNNDSNPNLDSKLLLKIISNKGIGYDGGSVLFYSRSKDTSMVKSYFKLPKIRALLSEKHQHVKFLWGIVDESGLLPFYAAKSSRSQKAFVTGVHISKAYQNMNAIGRPSISLEMDEDGAKRWEAMTEQAFINQSQIAITINNLVYSAPGVISGPIRGGHSKISGNFTLNEAQNLAVILNSSQAIPQLELLRYSTDQD